MFLGRVVQPGEPLWTDEDREWALALYEEERDACPGCGHPRSESMRPDAEFTYVAEVARCHACTPLEAKKAQMRDAEAGLLFGTRKR